MVLAFKIQVEDVIIIIATILIVVGIILFYYYRMHVQNVRHTTMIFVELEILITDFRKSLDRVNLFKRDEYSTEIEVHERNYKRYRDLITQIQTSRVKNRSSSIFDIEKKMDIDTKTIIRQVKKEIRHLISYLQTA